MAFPAAITTATATATITDLGESMAGVALAVPVLLDIRFATSTDPLIQDLSL